MVPMREFKSDKEKIDDAEVEIAVALSKTLSQLRPQLTAKFGIDDGQLNLAICLAAIRTTVMASMASVGASRDQHIALGRRLRQVVFEAIDEAT